VFDFEFQPNAPRGNLNIVAANALIRNAFTTNTATVTDTGAYNLFANNADFDLTMSNYKSANVTRNVNGAGATSQRYFSLIPSGIGSDFGSSMLMRNDVGRTAGMIITIFGLEKTREFYEADAGNVGTISFTNDGKVWIANSGDRFVLTCRRHYGITAWGDVILDGTGTLNFTIEFRAAEGTNAHSGSWLALTTANLTSATSGFTDMKNNGVTIQYRITHNASNLTDNLNVIELRCTTDDTFTVPYTVEGVVSSSGYSLHKRLDMTDCRVDGTLTFTTAGSYTLTNCMIGTVVNTSGGNVTITPAGSTTIATNSGPNITINATPISLSFTGLQAGSEVRAYTGTDPATAVEIGGVESSGTSFSFNHTSGSVAGYFRIISLGYLDISVPLTYLSENQSIPIQQQVDRQYSNP
jgi:hypothetical protein